MKKPTNTKHGDTCEKLRAVRADKKKKKETKRVSVEAMSTLS